MAKINLTLKEAEVLAEEIVRNAKSKIKKDEQAKRDSKEVIDEAHRAFLKIQDLPQWLIDEYIGNNVTLTDLVDVYVNSIEEDMPRVKSTERISAEICLAFKRGKTIDEAVADIN